MENNPELIYIIDSNDIIVEIISYDSANEYEIDMGKRNNFFQIIHSPELEIIFRAIFSEVRNGKIFTSFYRCDTSEFKRKYKFSAKFENEMIILKHFLVYEEKIDSNVMFVEKGGELLRMCAWCNKFYVAGRGWMELEDALFHLNIFEEIKISPISHGICEPCSEILKKEIRSLKA